MSDKPEHTADISAELRTLSRGAECCELQPKVFGKPIAQYLAELADRIDAAVKRECGNRESLRMALLECVDMLSSFKDDPEVAESISIADSALANPPRNCDVGTPSEQRARFDKFCRSNSWDEIDGAHCMSSCPLYHGDCSRCEELEWAQMPYEKGEADGK